MSSTISSTEFTKTPVTQKSPRKPNFYDFLLCTS